MILWQTKQDGLLQLIHSIDQWLFIQINSLLTTPFLDALFPVWRESLTWLPVYLFLLLFVLLNFGRKALPWIILFIVTVSLCDQLSSAVLKDWIGRLRPCRNPDFSQYVRLLLNRCPVSGSFTSSHATNHFGMAMFIASTMKKYFGKHTKWFFVWAATIAYGQVYIGVHYPFDVVGGAALGMLLGWAIGIFFNAKFSLEKQTIIAPAERK